jgi:hypothetical protein
VGVLSRGAILGLRLHDAERLTLRATAGKAQYQLLPPAADIPSDEAMSEKCHKRL